MSDAPSLKCLFIVSVFHRSLICYVLFAQVVSLHVP